MANKFLEEVQRQAAENYYKLKNQENDNADVDEFMGQFGFKPIESNPETKDNGYLGSLKDGFDSGVAGVFSGITGIPGKNAASEYFDGIVQNNRRNKEFDTVFSLDYLTDPQGLAYDAGSFVGSSAALAPAAALIPESLVAGGAGLIGGALAKYGTKGLANWAASQTGKKALQLGMRGSATSVPESLSEWGSSSIELEQQGDKKHTMNSFPVFMKNMAVLPVSNALEYMLLGGKLFNPSAKAGEKLLTRAAKAPFRASPAIAANAFQNATEELLQQTFSDQAAGRDVGNVLDPTSWTDSQRQSFEIGLAGSAALGGASGMYHGMKVRANNEQISNNKQNNDNTIDTDINIANNPINEDATDNQGNSFNLVNKVRNLTGKIPYVAEDGTNCMRTMGIALEGTPFAGQINVDQAVATAGENGLLKDPSNYTPKAGDMAVVNDGNHIVMVTEGGGTIQNGKSHNGVYESKQSPTEMFGGALYYIQTSVYNKQNNINVADDKANVQADFSIDDKVNFLQDSLNTYNDAVLNNEIAEALESKSDSKIEEVFAKLPDKPVKQQDDAKRASAKEITDIENIIDEQIGPQEMQLQQTRQQKPVVNPKQMIQTRLGNMINNARAGKGVKTRLQKGNNLIGMVNLENELKDKPNIISIAQRAVSGDKKAMHTFYKLRPGVQAALKNIIGVGDNSMAKDSDKPIELSFVQEMLDLDNGKENSQDAINQDTNAGFSKAYNSQQQLENYQEKQAQEIDEIEKATINNSDDNLFKQATEYIGEVSPTATSTEKQAYMQNKRQLFTEAIYDKGNFEPAYKFIDRVARNPNDYVVSKINNTDNLRVYNKALGTYDVISEGANADYYEHVKKLVDSENASNMPKAELAKGYATQSGNSLHEVKFDEFIIKPDGSMDFGEITQDIEKSTKGKVKAGKIRLQVGFNRDGDKGAGLIHIKKREPEFKKVGYASAEDYITNIAQNFNEIYSNRRNADRITLVKNDNLNAVMPVDLSLSFDGENYYVIVSAMPMRDKTLQKDIQKETLLYRRRPSPATNSNVGVVQNGENSKFVGAEPQGAMASKENVSFVNSNLAQNDSAVNVAKLAKVYGVENGKSINNANKYDFITTPNGSKDFGYINDVVAKATDNKIVAAPIRLQLGDANTFGYLHILKHEKEIQSKGFTNILDYINYISNNFTRIYSQQQDKKPNRFVLYCNDKSKGLMPIDLELKDDNLGFYTIVSAYPSRNKIKGTLIYDENAPSSVATTDNMLLAGYNNNGGVAPTSVNAKSNVSFVNSNLAQNDSAVNGQSTTKEKSNIDKNTKVAKYDERFVSKSMKHITQTAELKGEYITVTSKPSKEAMREETYDVYIAEHKFLPNGSYTFNINDLKKENRSANQNVNIARFLKPLFIEAFAYSGEKVADNVLNFSMSDSINSIMFDVQISAVKKMIAKYDEKNSVSEEIVKENRFDGDRAIKSLDKLIGRKQKAENDNSSQNTIDKKTEGKKFVDVFDETELDAEIQKAKEQLSKLHANPFFDPSLMKSLVKIGGIYFQKGINNISDWTAHIVKAMGEDVRPFLKSIWNTLEAYPNDVKFNDDIMTAVMEFVGNKADNKSSIEQIKKEFADMYGKDYLAYVDAAYKGIIDYPTEIESKKPVEQMLNDENEKQELTETIKEQRENLSDEENELLEGLPKEVKEVYVNVRNSLNKQKNSNIEANKMSAIIFSRHAESYAKAVRETGKNYTALDYLNDNIKAINPNAKYEEFAKGQGYNQDVIAQEQLALDEIAWGNSIDSLTTQRNKNTKPHMVKIMQTPLVMQMTGVKNLPIYINSSKYFKIQNDHPAMTNNVLKQLPTALTDPVAILKSNTRDNRLVVVLELLDENKTNIIVPFELNASVDQIEMNILVSAYGKNNKQGQTNTDWIKNHIEKNALYVNRKKVINLFTKDGVQFPISAVNKINDFSNTSILTEADLVKLKEDKPFLYQNKQTPQGNIIFNEGKAIISLFENANESTFVHELGHLFLTDLKVLAEMDNVPNWVVKDFEIAKKWLDLKDEQTGFTREQQERFAKGFEKYLQKGKAPISALEKVFEKFKQWLTRIYKDAKALDVEISPDIEKVFDRMLGAQKQISKQQAANQTNEKVPDVGAIFYDNEALNGIEIKFKTKPSGDFIASVKEAGYRWSPRRKLWYSKKNDKAIDFAKSIGYKTKDVVKFNQTNDNAKTFAKGDEQDVGDSRGLQDISQRQVPEGLQANEKGQDVRRVRRQEDRDGESVLRGHTDEFAREKSLSTASDRVRESAAYGVLRDAGEGDNKRVPVQLKPSQRKKAKASETSGHNFKITAEDNIGKGGAKTKYKDNIAAIELLKELESEQRLATPEEQKILARYVGWGGLSPVFNIWDTSSDWVNESKHLKELLDDEEYEQARRSTLNAHYTSPVIIKGIWSIAERLGFKGGRVLEPSMGIGNFFGLMPDKIMANSTLSGVELDSLTGRIAKQLYQKANIEVTGFEKIVIPDNFYDLIISNVPFGDYKLHDPKYNKYKYNIHNYFFAKALDKVRPGGLVMFITGSGTMQAGQDSFYLRSMLSKNVDMLGAVRLPNTTFKENAGTQVTTDLIIFRKRDKGDNVGQDNQNWLETIDSDVIGKYTDRPLAINEYYVNNPDMLIGKLVEDKLYSGGRLALDGEGLDVGQELINRVKKFPKDVYIPVEYKKHDSIQGAKDFLAPSNVRDLSYALDDKGIAYQNNAGTMVIVPKAEQARAKSFVDLKSILKNLLSEQIDPATTDDMLKNTRDDLNRAYDDFVDKFGYVNSKTNVQKLGSDPEYGIVRSIENYKEDKKSKKITVSKNDIFTKRTVGAIKSVEYADSPVDALSYSLSETGGVDIDYIANLLSKKSDEVMQDLDSLIFENPITREYQTVDEYLSGNVREKLEAAQEAAKTGEKYNKNVLALQKVQPVDLKPEEISVSLGATWLPTSDIETFAADMLGYNSTPIKIIFNAPTGSWIVSWDEKDRTSSIAKNSAANRSTWGSAYKSFYELLDCALNQRSPVVYDTDADGKKTVNQSRTTQAQEKLDKIKQEFEKWLWKDESRTDRLVNYYNNNFNNWHLREYDGSHLTLPGYSAVAPKLKKHQKDAIWRILQSGNTLLSHCVGAGKTWTMQTSGMELRRLGIAKKPLYVIPNNMIGQFYNEFLVIYPNAKLLIVSNENLPDVNVAGKNTLSKSEFAKRRAAKNSVRQQMLGRIATEDWDGIIISHNMFKRIPMSPEAYNSFYKQQAEELSSAILEMKLSEGKSYNRIVKDLEKQKEKIEEHLRRDTSEETKDIVIPFEQLGIDQIFVDEADLFKNLAFTTKMTRIAGINNTGSQRSMDMFVKTQYLTNLNNGRGVVFATGTPISNSMCEMFTMKRYLDLATLKEKNLHYFDSWAANFANIGVTTERSPDGIGYRQINKVTSFVNAPEMIKMFRKFADVKTQDELNLDIPKLKNNKVTVVEVQADETLKDYIANEIKDRSKKIKNGQVKPTEDNMLKLTNDLRKASLDMRLIDSSIPVSKANGKLEAVVDNAFNKYKKSDGSKGAQLIFCDLSTPKASSDKIVEETDNEVDVDVADVQESTSNIVVYEEIKKMLVNRGIPSNEIAFIHDAKTKDKKQSLFENVNAGNVRILIGSTDKMGAGTNAQKKLVALHHVDAPWRPRDIEQREGRILRQGNENKEVEIFTYVKKDSFDANMWEKLKNKASIISQAMSSNLTNRVIEDMDAVVLSFAEVEALASGNPLMAEKTMVDAEVTKYSMLFASYNQQKAANERKIISLPALIEQQKNQLGYAKEDIKNRKNITGNNFAVELSGKIYTDRKVASDIFEKLINNFADRKSAIVGKIGGFDLRLQKTEALYKIDGQAIKQGVNAVVVGKSHYTVPTLSMQSIEHTVMNAPDKMVLKLNEDIASNEKDLTDIQKELNKPFEYQEKYDNLVQRQKEINTQLNVFAQQDKQNTQDSNLDSEDTQFSVYKQEEIKRSIEELQNEVTKAFPKARNVEVESNKISFTMPNKTAITVLLKDKIIVGKKAHEKIRLDNGFNFDENIVVEGYSRKLDNGALIALSKESREGTGFHEAFHAAWDLALTSREKFAMLKYYEKRAKQAKINVQELMADEYKVWQKAKEIKQGSIFGKLFGKIYDFVKKMQAVLAKVDNVHNVFRKIAEGKVWENANTKKSFEWLREYGLQLPDLLTKKSSFLEKSLAEKQVIVNKEHASEDISYAANKKDGAGIDKQASENDNVGKELSGFDKGTVFNNVMDNIITTVETLKAQNLSDKEINLLLTDEKAIYQVKTVRQYKSLYEQFNSPQANKRELVVQYSGSKLQNASKEEINNEFERLKNKAKAVLDYANFTYRQTVTVDGRGIGQSSNGLYNESRSWSEMERVSQYDTRRTYGRIGESLGETARDIQGTESQRLDIDDKKYSVKQGAFLVDDINYSARRAVDNLNENLNKLTANKEDSKIEIRSKTMTKESQFGLINSILRSPSYLAKKFPQLTGFFKMADKAMQKQEELRGSFRRTMNKIYKELKQEQDHKAWGELLLQGDYAGKEYTVQELKQEGYTDNIIKAYVQTRLAIKKAYNLLNDARKKVVQHQKNMTKSELDELKENIFAEIVKIEEKGDSEYLVVWKQQKTWINSYVVSKEVLDDMTNGTNKHFGNSETKIQVISATANNSGEYIVKTREGIGELSNRKGYIPHFFHEFFVMKKVDSGKVDEDGKTIYEYSVVGSARTVNEARQKAERYLQSNPDYSIAIQPKTFSFDKDEQARAAVIGDSEYAKIIQNISEQMEITPEQAKEFMSGKIKMKPRHRFFGNFMKRKGVEGFDTDMDWVLNHYFNASSRFVALEEFKPAAIGLFERYFGRFDNDYTNRPLARYVKQFINDINGNPSDVEVFINNFLNNLQWWQKHVTSNFGDRAALQLASSITGKISILKLGFFNISSALLNMTQLMNTVGILGDFSAVAGGMKNALKPKISDKKIFKEAGIFNDIQLDSASGYSKFTPRSVLGKSMYLFKAMDMYARQATVLAAYHKGRKDGMNHSQAISYAREVNRKANFDYSVADAPNVFRRGSIFSQIMLQFKKYPIKELELMYELATKGNLSQNAKFWGTYFLLCGLLQVPALDWFDNILSNLFGASPKTSAKELIIKAAGDSETGKELAKVALYGLFSAKPINADISSRVGVGDITLTAKGGLDNLLGGPAYSTISKSAQAIVKLIRGNGTGLELAKALSPAVANYMQAYEGETKTSRDRTNSKLDTMYDSLLKASGFRNAEDSMINDAKEIASKKAKLDADDRKAIIDKVIKNKEKGIQPSADDVKELRRLRVTPKMLSNERNNKKMDAGQRMIKGMSKQSKRENSELLKFLE